MQSTKSRRRRLLLEPLESRLLMAGDVSANPAPLPADDSFFVHQNADPQSLDVLHNDTFPASYGGARRISAVSFGSEGGRVAVAADGQSVIYSPPADYYGAETFVYYVDGVASATATVQIDSPLTDDDHFSLLPGSGQRTLDVLANDPFWSGYTGSRQITAVSETSIEGTAAIAPDGRSIHYTPPEFGSGQDRFIYIVDGRYPAEVRIDVPRLLRDDEFPDIVQNSDPQRLNVLANDPFSLGYAGAKRITALADTDDERSRVAIAADGRSLIYEPAADFNGFDSFRYIVDGAHEARVRVQVHRPVQDDWFEFDAGSRRQKIDLLANDTYRFWEPRLGGGGRLVTRDVVDRVTAVSATEEGGVVELAADGLSVSYTAPAGFVGEDAFTYTADGKYTARVAIRLTDPVRDDYFGYGDAIAVYQDGAATRLDVLRNDFQGNGYDGAKIITSTGAAAEGGTVAIVDGGAAIAYTPSPGYIGVDSFEYTLDGTYSAHVSVYVRPRAASDHFSFCAASPNPTHILNVLDNDAFSAADGYAGGGRITSIGSPEGGGQATISADGRSIAYTPGPRGGDRFTYRVDDTYEATISTYIDSHLVGDSIVVDQNSDAASIDVLANDFPDRSWSNCRTYSGPRRITAVSSSEKGGEVSISSDGASVLFSPAADFVGADSFTYTVDGVMQTTVNVQVVRRVRDDRYHVPPNAIDEPLPVLFNDLFGADYRGAGQVTGVSVPNQGGSAIVAADGRSIVYTPVDGFVGEESFVYTVDGRLKARVTIQVGEPASGRFPKFETLDEFQQFLIDDALARYGDLFGTKTDDWPWSIYARANGIGGIETTTDTFAPGTAADSRSHSETNVQVDGVDEADLLENDGEFLYLLRGGEMIIARAWPATQMNVVSRSPIEGTPVGQYLNGDRLTVISRLGDAPWRVMFDAPAAAATADSSASSTLIWLPGPFPKWSPTTVVTVFDVSDRQSPRLVQTTKLDGEYVESRRINDQVFVVLRNDQVELPPPNFECEPTPEENGDPELATSTDAANAAGAAIVADGAKLAPITFAPQRCTYESRESYLARVAEQMGTFLDDALPHFASYDAGGDLIRSGLLTAPEELFRPLSDDSRGVVSVVSLDMQQDEPGVRASAGVFTTGASVVYGARDHLYVFDNPWNAEDGATTRVMQFDWDASTGSVAFTAVGEVAGSMLNQFSADAFAGDLRIATSISNAYSGNWTGKSENALFVLREENGVLEVIGSLQNLALNESIRSVRFLADRAFVTTFRTVDPLFAIDLSDPESPHAVGHVTLPGFNTYMQLIDSDHLLAVGKNAPAGGWGPTQVSLFDIRNLARPELLQQFTFARFSNSEAESDHHAFGWFADHGVLTLPLARSVVERIDADGDGYRESRRWTRADSLAVLRIDVGAVPLSGRYIQSAGEIEHDSAVRRGAFIEDVLYSFADASLAAAPISDPSDTIDEVRLESADDGNGTAGGGNAGTGSTGSGDPASGQRESTMKSHADKARAALAAHLGVPADAPVVLAIESGRDNSAVTGDIVLGLGDQRFHYRSDSTGDVLLETDDFEFAGAGSDAASFHNRAFPVDVDGNSEISPRDALLVIDQLNREGARRLRDPHVLRQVQSAAPARFRIDVNGDGFVSPIDALLIINRLNVVAGQSAEGEQAGDGVTRSEPSVRSQDAPIAAVPLAVDMPTIAPAAVTPLPTIVAIAGLPALDSPRPVRVIEGVVDSRAMRIEDAWLPRASAAGLFESENSGDDETIFASDEDSFLDPMVRDIAASRLAANADLADDFFREFEAALGFEI